MINISTLFKETDGRGTFDLTMEIRGCIEMAGIANGLCHVFVHHTSASLMFCENADPSVRRDLETFMSRIAPDGDSAYEHDSEGPDDMPAHIRSVLTQTEITLPVENGRPNLGTWQGLYLWEHRHHPHRRKITVTVIGE
jgi:secondary thiamine-phosphate synthase enzyme